MKKKLIAIIIFSFLVLGTILFSIFFIKTKSSKKFIDLYINNQVFKVEIADIDASREKGLSGRKDMPKDNGMLFVFPATGYHAFWMKGMLFPLDFIWIRDETIVDITENVAFPTGNETNNNLPRFTPRERVDKVLELNAGIVKKYNIKIRDKIRF